MEMFLLGWHGGKLREIMALRGGVTRATAALPPNSAPISAPHHLRAHRCGTRNIERLISDGWIVLRDLLRWKRESLFADLGQFVAYLTRVDPGRAELAARHAPQLSRAWRENNRSRDGKAVLVQPMICWTLSLPNDKGPRP